MKPMEPISEVTQVVIPAKSVAEQILEAPVGSVFAEISTLGPEMAYRTVTRTGVSGWWVSGQGGYWHADDIERWARENVDRIVALHIAPDHP